MIEQSEGYKSLLAAVEKDEAAGRHHDYRGKLKWVVDRANHYSEKTGLPADEILNAWEKKRSYWYMNYYQDCNQPEIKAERVRVFETTEELVASIGDKRFRCPHCNGVSRSPYACNSGVELLLINSRGKPEICNWKVGGLFGSLGKGVHVFVKSELAVEEIFMPIAWETEEGVDSREIVEVQDVNPEARSRLASRTT